MITYYLRNFWEDLQIEKINKLNEDLNIPKDILLDILEGKKKLVAESGTNYVLEDDDDSYEHLHREAIHSNFEYKFKNYVESIVGYSKGISNSESPDDLSHYFGLVEKSVRDFDIVRKNYSRFCDLIGVEKKLCVDFFIEKYYNNSQEDEEEEEETIFWHDEPSKESYHSAVKGYLSTLDFEYKHTVNRLISERNYQAIRLLQTDFTNGLLYIPSHKYAQEEVSRLRGQNIERERILDTIWNSGWLDKEGYLYGCPDLDHTNFSSELIKFLGLEETNNPDRVLEKAGFIKFSMGRWLYMDEDLTPTVEQLRTILEWNDKRNKSLKLCIGDGSTLTNVDIVETRLHSLLKSN